jgi:hypothetical protein
MVRMRTTLVVVMVLGSARLAAAADHNMVISEVLLSSGGSTGVQFVELTDAVNQPFPAPPYGIEIYDADGTLLGDTPVAAPASTTRLLISTAAADTALGTVGDAVLDVALPTDGQVCFVRSGGGKIHCLAWGCVTTLAGSALQTGLGATPPDGMSVQRQVAGTYAVAAPTPDATPNTVAAAQPACPGGTPDAGPTVDADPAAPDADPGSSEEDDGGGCCSTGGDPGGAILLSLVALIAIRKRY